MTIPAITLINTKAVIDGTGSRPMENVTVVLEGDIIKNIQPRGQISLPPGCNPRILDFPKSVSTKLSKSSVSKSVCTELSKIWM